MDLTVFIHVPRTAGTSFRIYAEKALGKGNILPIYGPDIVRAVEILQQPESLKGKKLVRGHITTACMKVLSPDTKYLTILRNPVTRVASLYKYILRDKGHPVHNLIAKMTLGQFVASKHSLEVNDGMIRQLCGTEPELPQSAYDPKIHEHTPYGETTRAMLAEALVKLSEFAVVGVMENLSDTLKLMYRYTGWQKHPFQHVNKTRPMPISQDDRKAIGLLNELDFELWRLAQSRLKEDMQWL